MMGDPDQVRFNVWFLPESGNDPEAQVLDNPVGWRAAAEVVRAYFERDFKEPEHYGSMYVSARSMLRRWEQDPDKWCLCVPVHYGSLVIA